MGQGTPGGLNRQGLLGDRKPDGNDKKEKKFEPAAPPVRVGRKQRKQKGPEAAEKALKHLNPDGEEDLLCSKTEHHPKELMMKLNLSPSQDQSKAEPWLFKPKAGSVFPAKKRSVQRMMFDQIVQCFCSVSDDTKSPSASAGASETTSNANKVISNHVYPSP